MLYFNQHLDNSAQLRSVLDSRMNKRDVRKGEILYMPGDPAKTLYLLKTGRIQQYHLSFNGRKLVTTLLEPGDIFGMRTLTNGDPHHLFAEAVEDSVVLTLDGQRTRRLLMQEPEAMHQMTRELVRRLNRTENRLATLVFEPIRVRLAGCLLEVANSSVVKGYSHEDLAEILGTNRVAVTQILNDFKDAGLIDIHRLRIEILDEAHLREMAGEEHMSQIEDVRTNGATTSHDHHAKENGGPRYDRKRRALV